MIELKNIDLNFSDKQIFNSLNISIEKGENVIFSGASGRGKSTLLKMIQGYVLPDNGEIFVDKWQLTPQNIKNIRNSVVWIPQNINLPVNNGIELLQLMNISDNLPKVHELAKNLMLEKELLSKDFTKISGGQKQRVIISICLSIDRDIILMDEPTSALDADSISALIQTLSKLENKTIVSASHNEQWLKEAGRVVKL